MNKWWFYWVFFLAMSSCSSFPQAPVPLASQGPRVVSWMPVQEGATDIQPAIDVVFSEPVDPATVNSSSVILAQTPEDLAAYEDAATLFKAIDKGKLVSVPLLYQWADDGYTLHLEPAEALVPGGAYLLAITSRVLSTLRVPFDQGGQGYMEPFVASYETGTALGETGAPVVDEAAGIDAPGAGVAGTLPFIVINEVLYDIEGSDTDGQVFVELSGESGTPLGGLLVEMVNGTDGKILQTLPLPEESVIPESGFFVIADERSQQKGASQVSPADWVTDFDPQNGPDTVRLITKDGAVLDVLGYGKFETNNTSGEMPLFEGQAAMAVMAGHSLERKEAGLDTGDNSNDFVERDVPTPGSQGLTTASVPSGLPAPAEPVPVTRSQGKVVLNEIYYDAVGSDTDGLLFVELYGTPSLSLSSYQVRLVNGDDAKVYDVLTLPQEAQVPVDGYYVIADERTGQPDATQVPGADFITNFDPQNGPDAIQLFDEAGVLLDAVAYGPASGEGDPAVDVISGHSIERVSPGFDTDDNAADFMDQPGPTPGW